MIKRKLEKDEFILLFFCYLSFHVKAFDGDAGPFDEYESMAINLVKQEALDVIAFWEKDREAKKIKREFFKTNFMTAKAFSDSGDKVKARYYTKKAFMDGYSYFYGETFMSFLAEQAKPILAFVKEEKLEKYLLSSENEFKVLAIMSGATERLMMQDGIKL